MPIWLIVVKSTGTQILKNDFVFVFAEFYREIGDEADVPDKLELSFRLDDKPVQLRLERSDSIPADPPVIVSQDHRRSYWSRKPGSVNDFMLLISYSALCLSVCLSFNKIPHCG